MRSMKIRSATAGLVAPLLLSLTQPANADVVFGQGAQVFDQTPNLGDFVLVINGPQSLMGDYSVPEAGFVRLAHFANDASLTVNNSSTLNAGFGLFTTSSLNLNFNSNVLVDGTGSRIEIGSNTFRTGTIRLNGKGDFDIIDGGVVNWLEPNNCDGTFTTCDILIGSTAASNTGIRVIGNGSLLDASNTDGRFFVGWVPSTVPYDPSDPPAAPLDSEDFFVVADGGTALTTEGGVGKGFEPSPAVPVWSAGGVGFVHGTAFIDNGSWFISQSSLDPDAVLNIAEGDGGSGNVFVVNGGLVDVTADPGGEAAFFLGQSLDGDLTQGGSSLLLIDGAGSMVNINDNANTTTGSRIVNGFVTVQNDGALVIDSSVFIVTGNSGASLSLFNTDLAFKAAGITGLSSTNLDVLSGGSVTVTDADAQGISALVLGQAPLGLPTQSASTRVSGAGSNITVSNDPSLAKIPLSATDFGLPLVSNIGTGSLTVESGGAVDIQNGDFVIAVRDADDADVFVTNATLSADRVILGWSDFDGGAVAAGASSGLLSMNNGVINGDLIVDDNGILVGVGTVNGTLFAEGGIIDPGFSPGTITVENFVLADESKLIMELALNADGSVNTAGSDAIVATAGGIDLSGGTVTFELSSADPSISVEEIVSASGPLNVTEVFDAGEPVAVGDFELTDSSGSISDQELEQQVAIVSFEKDDCKDDGWSSLTQPDGSSFDNQGLCIKYVNTGM